MTIDHINNDGAKLRRQWQGGSRTLYAWLKRNEYPKNDQILCWNCQWGKRLNNGMCPHKKETITNET